MRDAAKTKKQLIEELTALRQRCAALEAALSPPPSGPYTVPADPAWYRNLQAHPHATVEVGDKKFHVHPRTAEGAERERMGALVDYFEGEQKKTSRQIPVVVLEPAQ